MNALLVISSLCLLLATHTTAQDQATKPVDGINPANAGSVCFRGNNVGQVVTFVADEENKCWYVKFTFTCINYISDAKVLMVSITSPSEENIKLNVDADKLSDEYNLSLMYTHA